LLIFLPGLLETVRAAPLGDTVAVIYLGLFPAALGYVTWAYALTQLPASRAASFLYLQPLLVLGIAWVWLGEWPSVLALCGGVLVLAGVMAVNARGQGFAVPAPLHGQAELPQATHRSWHAHLRHAHPARSVASRDAERRAGEPDAHVDRPS
jgi:hypothetical protein